MLICFENVRQTNEKIEQCVKTIEQNRNSLTEEMREVFKFTLVKLIL